MTAAQDLEAVDKLVEQMRPTQYVEKAEDFLRGSLPRQTFRDGGRSSSSPEPALDKTDKAVEAERREHRALYATLLGTSRRIIRGETGISLRRRGRATTATEDLTRVIALLARMHPTERREHRPLYARLLKTAERIYHIEKVMLKEKKGLRAEAGWPCVNWGKVWYGEVCKTDVHDHPKAVCQACRDRKHRTEKAARSAPVDAAASG